MTTELSPKPHLLFIGDSITDCDRLRTSDGLGNGYVRLIRDYLCAKNPSQAPAVTNVGISANKVTDLAARWKKDVLNRSPDLLSMKIGINDVWQGFKGDGVPIEQFTDTYRQLLQNLKQDHPACRLVLCEPSVIWVSNEPRGNQILLPYVLAIHALAEEFNAHAVVRLHDAFLRARAARPDIDWTPDGVHPSSAGHMLIARTWLAATGLL